MPFNRITLPPDIASGLAEQCRPAITTAAADLTWTDQTALVFGSDRNDPVPFRPALVKRRNAPTHAVLPGTKNSPDGNRVHFFCVPRGSNGVTPHFGETVDVDTFLYRVAETVDAGDLGGKIAAVSPDLNREIERWYRDCGARFLKAEQLVASK